MKKSGFSITFLVFIALIVLVIIFVSSRVIILGENSLEGLTINRPATISPVTTNPDTSDPDTTDFATISPATTSPVTTKPYKISLATTSPVTTSPDTSSPSVTTSGVVYTTFTPSATTSRVNYEPTHLESAIKSLHSAVIVREHHIKTGNNKQTIETLKDIINNIKTIIDNKD